MKSALYQQYFKKGKKFFALLIDPGKTQHDNLFGTLEAANKSGVDLIFVGGSLTSVSMDKTIETIKQKTKIPVILFPGNLLQLSTLADGILLISLLSGRNPEYLIGNHVLASQYLKNSGLELIPTGYILVDGHNLTSVEYISNTRPIPSEKTDIIMATALAGEQLGLKLIYLEAGSGASKTIGADIVSYVKSNISIPLIVGGGIRSPQQVRDFYKAGANGVVVGTAIEKDYQVLEKLVAVKYEF